MRRMGNGKLNEAWSAKCESDSSSEIVRGDRCEVLWKGGRIEWNGSVLWREAGGDHF